MGGVSDTGDAVETIVTVFSGPGLVTSTVEEFLTTLLTGFSMETGATVTSTFFPLRGGERVNLAVVGLEDERVRKPSNVTTIYVWGGRPII